MYWEELYAMYEYACNMQAIEKNEDMKFNFMLHAGSKDAIDKWKDIPVPYPDRGWLQNIKEESENRLPSNIKQKFYNSQKGTEETRKRALEVKRRVEETQRKAREMRAKQMRRQYTQ
jgi:hypothetical protein